MRRPRVLIIDDEPKFARLLRLNLEATGRYEARELVHSFQAMALVRLFRPDVILLDVVMPDVDGGQLVRALQSDPATKDIPIVLLTGLLSEEYIKRDYHVTGLPCLLKPIHLQELVACLERVVPRTAGADLAGNA